MAVLSEWAFGNTDMATKPCSAGCQQRRFCDCHRKTSFDSLRHLIRRSHTGETDKAFIIKTSLLLDKIDGARTMVPLYAHLVWCSVRYRKVDVHWVGIRERRQPTQIIGIRELRQPSPKYRTNDIHFDFEHHLIRRFYSRNGKGTRHDNFFHVSRVWYFLLDTVKSLVNDWALRNVDKSHSDIRRAVYGGAVMSATDDIP